MAQQQGFIVVSQRYADLAISNILTFAASEQEATNQVSLSDDWYWCYTTPIETEEQIPF